MPNFTNQTPASTYPDILTIGTLTQVGLTNVLSQIQDAYGNPSPLSLSTIAFNISRSGFTWYLDSVAVTSQAVDINSMAAPNPVALGTASLTLPVGPTSARPTGPTLGMERYNTTTGYFEGYTGSGWVNFAVSGGVVTTLTGTVNQIDINGSPTIPAAGDVTISIDPAYPGQTSITTIGTITSGIWNGTVISPAFGGTGVNNNTSTITIGGNFAMSGAHTFTGTLTGNTSVTFPTSGTLATTSQIPAGAALTEANDTNVTLTLSGTPATALLQAVEITAGWTGTLAVGRGGTGVGTTTAYGVLIGGTTGTSAFQNAGTGLSNQIFMGQGSSAIPVWSTATYPATTTINQLLYSSSANTVTGLTTANSATMYTNSSGVPAWTASMTNGQLLIGNTGGSPTLATLTAGSNITITNAGGSITIAASGGSGGITTIDGDTGSVTGTTVTISGGTTGLTTSGSSTTLTLGGTLGLANGGTNHALTASNGGIVYSDASKLDILSGTATANQVLLSGSSTAPAWSTATYPATTTANQLLYSSATNTITGLTSANSAVLVTNSSGVPALSGSMTNGQLIIGSTGGTPAAATLTAGTNITITNAANSITINSVSTSLGLGVVTVSSSTQQMASGNIYLCSDGATLVTLTLPTTSAVGDIIIVVGVASGLFTIAQNASQLIHAPSPYQSSTTGTGGSVSSTTQGQVFAMICTTANTAWTATFGTGSYSFV